MGRHRYSLDEELTFSEAARELKRLNDPLGRKLRNMVVARERQIGRPIAVRLSGDKEPKLRVTLGAIYRHFPELRRARTDRLAETLRAALAEQESRTAERVLAKAREEFGPRIARLEKHAERARSGRPPSEPPR